MNKKILITGISGFVGHHFIAKSRPNRQLFGTYHQNEVQFTDITCYSLAITDTAAFIALLEDIKPDTVIHLAALSNPNYCENHPENCQEVNSAATFHLITACQERDIHFIFASTDLVFDGKKPPYTEKEATNGIMTYGLDKAKTEHLAELMYPNKVTIARLPLQYGWCETAPNFLTNWVKTLKSGNTIKAFTNEYRTAAWAGDVADGLLLLAEQEAKGIWHLGGPERQSRYDFAIEVTKILDVDPALVIPVLQKDIKMAAARPTDVSLNSEKATKLGYAPGLAAERLRMIL